MSALLQLERNRAGVPTAATRPEFVHGLGSAQKNESLAVRRSQELGFPAGYGLRDAMASKAVL
jgi:hypothetical protein